MTACSVLLSQFQPVDYSEWLLTKSLVYGFNTEHTEVMKMDLLIAKAFPLEAWFTDSTNALGQDSCPPLPSTLVFSPYSARSGFSVSLCLEVCDSSYTVALGLWHVCHCMCSLERSQFTSFVYLLIFIFQLHHNVSRHCKVKIGDTQRGDVLKGLGVVAFHFLLRCLML